MSDLYYEINIQSLLFLHPEFQASILLLQLYRPACVKSGRKSISSNSSNYSFCHFIQEKLQFTCAHLNINVIYTFHYFSLHGTEDYSCLIVRVSQRYQTQYFCVFELGFNIPVNNFSVMSQWSHHFLGYNLKPGECMCLALGHNMVSPVGIKSRTPRFRA